MDEDKGGSDHLEREADDDSDEGDDGGDDNVSRAMKQALDEETRPGASSRVQDGRVAKPVRKRGKQNRN